MPIDLSHEAGSHLVTMTFTGKLRAQDYDSRLPEIEACFAQDGRLNLLIEILDFEGWTAGAAVRDLALDFKHRHDVEKVAVVGDRKWLDWMTQVLKPFTAGEMRYFDVSNKDAAITWLNGHRCAKASG